MARIFTFLKWSENNKFPPFNTRNSQFKIILSILCYFLPQATGQIWDSGDEILFPGGATPKNKLEVELVNI